MRNYIILNNQNSNTISGLIIQELAPISKPAQRTQVETIDGRDGDIVTPLGYAAYDKTITIGLYGNFNINDIIAYFATKGTVIFSNEPDKYYYYQIVDQIDYERLVRYRVATVTMHVQPFKYSATEGTITVDSSDTVSGEGSDIALDGTAEAPFNVLRHKGNATQKTVSGKNLFKPYTTSGTASYNALTAEMQPDGTIKINGTASANSWFEMVFKFGTGTQGQTVAQFALDPTKNYTVSLTLRSGTVSNDAGVQIGVQYTSDNQYHTSALNTTWTHSGMDGLYSGFIRINSGTVFTNAILCPQLEMGDQATIWTPYVGGTDSPNPDYPQDIQVLTGDSTVKITGKNIINQVETHKSVSNSGSINTASESYLGIDGRIPVMPNTSYAVSFEHDIAEAGLFVGFWDADGNFLGREGLGGVRTFTAPANASEVFYYLYKSNNPFTTIGGWTQLEIGNTPSQYESYKEQSYVIPFGDTYLAKIGDYVDEPVKVDGTWYIRRAIGRVVFDGSESWTLASSGYIYGTISDAYTPESRATDPAILSDYFTPLKYNLIGGVQYIYGIALDTNNVGRIAITNKNFTTKSEYTTWLSTHNTTVYYALATPTDDAITDQDLIDALDELYNQAHAYKGHTHITATAADGNAPAVLAVDVNEDNESTVTNAGNTTSRPILTIYGQGDIGVYINDVEVLDVALGDEEYITLDSVEMEAYKDTTANLKNRLVTGDYSKLALNAGDNKIRFTGKVTKYEISKYSRWL